MNRVFSAVVTLAWAFWLGGLATLFATLGTIFTTPGYDRDVQGAFASRLFPMFERMQLIFAAVALLATTAWWMAGRARLKLVLFALFAASTVIVVMETTQITPRIEAMRVNGQRQSAQFDRLHKLSSKVYMSGAGVLLVAGLLLPSAIRGDAVKPSNLPQASEETAAA